MITAPKGNTAPPADLAPRPHRARRHEPTVLLPHREILAALTTLAARKSLGWTQEALAKRLGVSTREVSRWECGEREAPPYLADAIERD